MIYEKLSDFWIRKYIIEELFDLLNIGIRFKI